MEISFYIPNANTQFVGDENRPPAQVFREKIMSVADVGTGVEEAVVTFEGIAILTPRGRYSVKLHLSFLRLQGQANDFKIQYSSVLIHILNALRTKLVWMKVMMSSHAKVAMHDMQMWSSFWNRSKQWSHGVQQLKFEAANLFAVLVPFRLFFVI